MRRLQTLSDKSKPDPNIRLWAAVIRRAYLDAIGKVSDVYYKVGRCNTLENKKKSKINKKNIVKQIQKNAIRFIKHDYWIFDLCGISQDYTLKMIEKNKKVK